MAPAMARRALDDLAHGLTTEERATLDLLVSELVTNAVLHAGVAEGEAGMTLHVLLDSEGIRVEVRDRGRGFEKSAPVPRPSGRGGYGLLLVERMAARWGVAGPNGAKVWFEIDRAAS
jgi:anti-sigma regulatory factor (Ser/Thr protein kinase)